MTTTMLDLIRNEPRARRLLLAHAQSALGSGAGSVALLVVTWARFHSALAISVILLCDLAPAMGLGAVVGAAADRWPRRRLLVAGDLLRVFAFVGLALTGSFPLMVALALTSGVGQALFHPTVMATLPSLVSSERLPVATGLYGALREAGFALGPVIAAVAFVVTGADGVLLANAATFALSAALIVTIPCGRAALDRKISLRKALRDGRGALRAVPAARTVVLSSTAFVCFLGTVNVGELLLVRNTLGGTGTQYAIVVAVMGAGIVTGSLLAGRVSRPPIQAYLVGLGLCATGMAACAVAPVYAVALPGVAALGLGNGLALVSENVLLQRVIPAEFAGRVFGLKNSLVSWSFACAFLTAGAIGSALGARALYTLAAVGCLGVFVTARSRLAGAATVAPVPAPAAI
jgi:MFS family permease